MMILLIVLELWEKEMPYLSHIFMFDVSFQIFIFFKQLSPQNRSTRTIHRLLITFQIWFHLIYRSFDANHMENDQTVAQGCRNLRTPRTSPPRAEVDGGN